MTGSPRMKEKRGLPVMVCCDVVGRLAHRGPLLLGERIGYARACVPVQPHNMAQDTISLPM